MSDLETLVEKMERGDFTLEESIQQFERGMQLARQCQQALKNAEQKVMKLSASGSSETLEALDVDVTPADNPSNNPADNSQKQ